MESLYTSTSLSFLFDCIYFVSSRLLDIIYTFSKVSSLEIIIEFQSDLIPDSLITHRRLKILGNRQKIAKFSPFGASRTRVPRWHRPGVRRVRPSAAGADRDPFAGRDRGGNALSRPRAAAGACRTPFLFVWVRGAPFRRTPLLKMVVATLRMTGGGWCACEWGCGWDERSPRKSECGRDFALPRSRAGPPGAVNSDISHIILVELVSWIWVLLLCQCSIFNMYPGNLFFCL